MLPFGFMSQGVGQNIGNHLGRFLDYDDKNNYGYWRSFMRIHVMINVQKPKKNTTRIKKLRGEEPDMNLKYERLGPFCYLCGLIGHTNDSRRKLLTLGEAGGARK